MSAPAIISSGTAAGGPPVGGTGTTNTIPRWTGVSTLGDSLITQTLAGAPFEATRIRVATGVDTYAWFRDSAPSGNVLFVAANAAFGAYKGLEIASAGTYFTVGYVGIGTTSPARTLHVVATTAASPARLQNTVGSFELGFDASGAYFQPNTANTGVWLYTQAGSFFGISGAALTPGWVGVGTQSPADSGGWSAGRVLDVRSGSAGSSSVIYVGDSGRATNTQLGFYGSGYGFVGTVTNHAFRILQNNTLRGEWTTTSLDISSTSGYGLKLPATPGNADTQTLDCYAEGTWTPTLTGFGGTTPTVTSAKYTRVGRMVLLEVSINATGGATYSGTRAATYLSLPAGMVPPTISAAGAMTDSGINTLGTAVAYYNGNLYLPTFAATAVNTFVTVSYSI